MNNRVNSKLKQSLKRELFVFCKIDSIRKSVNHNANDFEMM